MVKALATRLSGQERPRTDDDCPAGRGTLNQAPATLPSLQEAPTKRAQRIRRRNAAAQHRSEAEPRPDQPPIRKTADRG